MKSIQKLQKIIYYLVLKRKKSWFFVHYQIVDNGGVANSAKEPNCIFLKEVLQKIIPEYRPNILVHCG
jgi:hypothetical protein